ncbi:MAG: tryptophan-rich sensory protein [Comamonadaceae bacterium]|nr:MAG: tryptophan-rich sensory protein [Comamonadaceae bacterium]
MSPARSWLGLAGWLAVAYAAAALGALASAQAGPFYLQLARPAWAPPPGVFGPVWTVLYGSMGVAAWWVWRSAGEGRRVALALFVAQLAVNTLWSWLFFHSRLGGWAFADILLLDVLVVATLAAFWRVRRGAGLLLAPYLAWIAFATALTWAVWRANPGLLQ